LGQVTTKGSPRRLRPECGSTESRYLLDPRGRHFAASAGPYVDVPHLAEKRISDRIAMVVLQNGI